MVKIVVLTPEEVTNRSDLVGTWINETHYKVLVEEDMDLYLPPNCAYDISTIGDCDKDCGNCESGLNEQNIVFKFRKNYFSKDEVESAYEGLRDAAASRTLNRGYAAGPRNLDVVGHEFVSPFQEEILKAFKASRSTIDDEDMVDLIIEKYNSIDLAPALLTKGRVWLSNSVKKYNIVFSDWIQATKLLTEAEAKVQATWLEDTCISRTSCANPVNSGIAGWYDRYNRIPYGRPTTYTREYPEKFAKAYPYLQSLAKGFAELLPWRYNNQMVAAKQIDPKFVIPGTPFTTVTVNRNFRTAAHYDPTNMENGFANICVVSKNDNYSGSYLAFPEIGYAINIRPSDLLFVNNQAGLHGNTELILHDDTAERVSMIAFFHEGMLKLGSYDYEETRREFVDSRRLNKEHPEQRNLWNGISPGLWTSDEWVDYLLDKGDIGKQWLIDYHKDLYNKRFNSYNLDDFFK